VAELEAEVTAADSKLGDAHAERDALAEELRSAHADLAGLGQRLAELQSRGDEVAEQAVLQERTRWEGADEELSALRRRLADSREQTAALEDELRRSQAALEEARHRMRQYEKRYGLEDAVREVDSLRDELTATQEELDDVSKKLEDDQTRFMTLSEISRKLAAEAGYDEGVDVFKIYPEHELRLEYATAVDRVRMDNAFLAKRVEELEAERVELLRQLRINSQQVGTAR
jgi:chromosome segregation ATPase